MAPTQPRDAAREPTSDHPATAEHLRPPEMKTLRTPALGELEIGSVIGRGAKGVVYLARNPRSNRPYALKVLTDDPEVMGAQGDKEGQIATQINHEGIVQVHNFDRLPAPDNRPYILMEFLEGETLRQFLDVQPMVSREITLHLARKIADAMATVHDMGLVHRDLKPQNIMLIKKQTDNDYIYVPKVLDFGLAQRIRRPGDTTESFGITQFRTVGTPKYIAPEQWQCKYVDGKADVYSLGVILYEMLAGRPPFATTNEREYARLHQFEAPPNLRECIPDLDPELAAFAMKLLTKEPGKRPSMADVKRDAERMLSRTTWGPGLSGELCPFPGLSAFSAARASFYKRADTNFPMVAAALHRDSESLSSWLHIEGPALSGKTSLVQAGLLPFLIKHSQACHADLTILSVNIDGDPLTQLAQSLASNLRGFQYDAKATERLLRERPENLNALINNWRMNRPLQRVVLLIDPLEKVLDAHPQSLRNFDAAIATALIDRDGSLFAITVLRSEHAVRLGRLPELLTRGPRPIRHILQPLDHEAIKDIISHAASPMGLTLEKGLSNEIASDSLSSTVGLPALGYTLRELWLRRQGKELTRAAYIQIGPVPVALARAADATLNLLSDDERSRARRLLVSLVHCGRGESDLLRALAWPTATHIAGGGAAGEQLLSTLLAPSQGAGDAAQPRLPLLRQKSTNSVQPSIELISGALVHAWPTLRNWLEEDRPILERWDDVEAAAGFAEVHRGAPLPRGEQLAYLRGAGLSAEQAQRLWSLLSEVTQRFLSDAERAQKHEHHHTTDNLAESVRRGESQSLALGEEIRLLRTEFSTKEQRYVTELEYLKKTYRSIRRSSTKYLILSGICGTALGVTVTHFLGTQIAQRFAELRPVIVQKFTNEKPITEHAITKVPDKTPLIVPDTPPVRLPRPPIEPGMVRSLGGTEMALLAQRDDSGALGSSPLWMDTTEVTVAAYKKCMSTGRCKYDITTLAPQIHPKCNIDRRLPDGTPDPIDTSNHPMNCVTAQEAEVYCRSVGKRLPEKTEWQFAVRGTNSLLYPWGNEAPTDQPCWKQLDGTCTVGSHAKDKSPLGLLDLAGNVQEWTATEVSKRIANSGEHLRLFMGGNWHSSLPEKLLGENILDPATRQTTLGFRCVRKYQGGDEG